MNKRTITFLVLFVLILVLFQFIISSIHIEGVILFYDFHFIYSVEDVRHTMEVLSVPQGTITLAQLDVIRTRFQQFYLLDVLFPLVYFSLIYQLSQSYKTRTILILPLVAMIFDYVENIIIFLFYSAFDVSLTFTVILHIVTVLKFALLITTIVLLIIHFIQQYRLKKIKTP